ncbi:MAG: hypothetical protein ACYCTD_04235, partial [bacterium]
MENNKKHDILRRFPSVQAILQNDEAVKLAESFPYGLVKEKLDDLIKHEKNKAVEFLNSRNESEAFNSFDFTVDYFVKNLKEDFC